MQTMHFSRHQSGSALMLSLVILLVLTGFGITTMNKSRFQEKLSNNQKISTLTLLAAEAALGQAKEKYSTLAQSGTLNPNWRQYIGTAAAAQSYFDYDSSNSQHHLDNSGNAETTIEYRHKTEWNMQTEGHVNTAPYYLDLDGNTSPASASSAKIIYYGYASSGDMVAKYFSPSGVTSAKPVEIITTVSIYKGSQRRLEMEMVKNPGPPIQGTVYSKQAVTINGSSGNFSGVDNCGGAASVPPVYTLSPAITNTSGSPKFTGNPAAPVSGPNDIDILGLINILKPGATVLTADVNNGTYGNTTNFKIIYSNTSKPFNNQGLKLSNVTGYGTLLVDGDLVLGGNVNWNGIILVSGTLTFNGGGGGINLRGAVFSQQSVDINGGLDLRYNSCNIQKSLQSLPLIVTRWKQLN